MQSTARWIAIAAILLFLAVSAGAFGAHALKDKLDAYQTGVYEKAVFYHLIHALGLLLVATLPSSGLLPEAAANRISAFLVVGVVLFSGSLYVLALTNIRQLGAITPLGGTAFLIAWGYLAFTMFTHR